MGIFMPKYFFSFVLLSNQTRQKIPKKIKLKEKINQPFTYFHFH